MHRYLTTLLIALFLFPTLHAQSFWQELPDDTPLPEGERIIVPKKYRTVRLDLLSLQSILSTATLSNGQTATEPTILAIPSPDGEKHTFRITETPVMAPALQAKYPQIRCYSGEGTGRAQSYRIKLDLTPQGFHAMVHTRTGTYFIDPMFRDGGAYYIVYYKKDYTNSAKTQAWSCEVHPPEEGLQASSSLPQASSTPTQRSQSAPSTIEVRRYRLAVACTGEYSQFHGGTIPLTLAAVNTTMHRVNGVYERDFAVTMQLIADNDQIVFLDGATDPYEEQSLLENQITIDSIIGSEQYDIGHLFRVGGGGVAFLNSPCNDDRKARGLTGLNQPVGDPFDIDYVSHEIGHQFGGRHTFNHCGSSNSAVTAMEPGSGTTIMAYAGICGADNVASNSQDIFHGYNITEMEAFIILGNGNTCAEIIGTENHEPEVDAGAVYTIPLSTPFAMTAAGADADGDTLTYTWEQMDFGNADSPPLPTTEEGPLFRSYKGNTSPIRVFPRLEDLVNNIDADWEELPGVPRTLNFRVVARDNHPGAGGVDIDDTSVRVAGNSGPFRVLSPDTAVVWKAGETQTVNWDVANTTAPPVACANVRISLSVDGGFTYPIVLLSTTPNDGSAEVQVPDTLSDNCRIKVEGLGNIFFDLSNSDFSIQPAQTPGFLLKLSTNEIGLCATEAAAFELELQPLLGFDTLVQIELSGGPDGMSTTLSSDSAFPGESISVMLDSLTSEMAGTYALTIQATAGTVSRIQTLVLTLAPGIPLSVDMIAPADGTTNVPSSIGLSWNATYADTYFIEVATSPAFDSSTLIYTAQTDQPVANLSGLTPATVYYWRARGANACAERPYEETYAFQTAAVSCDHQYSSTDVPVSITPSDTVTVSSALSVPDDQILYDLNLTLSVSHTYVGDLAASLISPANDTVLLFDRPGFPASTYGCDQNNLLLTFDQEADSTAAELENKCDDSPLALSGTFQPIERLDNLNGDSTLGEWVLSVGDFYAADGGAIESWSLDMCYAYGIPRLSILNKDTLYVPFGNARQLSADQLRIIQSDSVSQGQYVLLRVPEHGTLQRNGNDMVVGDTFTQQDILAGQVQYAHNGSLELSDHFRFDAFKPDSSNWLHNERFDIIVFENALSANAEAVEVSCAGGSDGSVSIAAAGGVPPYSLDGNAFTTSLLLDSLSAGDYIFTVTDAAGYSFELEATIVQPTMLNLNAALNGDVIVAVAAGGTPPYTYSLNDGPMQDSGVFTDLPPGDYTVMVTDANGCTTALEGSLSISSVVDPKIKWGLRVSPNPGDGYFTLSLQQAPGRLNMELFDAAGRLIRSYDFSPAHTRFETTLDLTGLPRSNYLLRLTDGKQQGAVWLSIVD